MRCSFGIITLVLAAGIVAPAPANAAGYKTTFAETLVRAGVPRGAAGYDAGIDVSAGRFVRLTASGGLRLLSFSVCGHQTGPEGCRAAFSFSRSAPSAPTGALVVAFVDGSGRLITSWAAVGAGAFIAVPANAARLVLRINGVNNREPGAVRVAADVVNEIAGGTQGAGGVRRPLAEARQVSAGRVITRKDVHYVLRRFGYSDTPENVTAVLASGYGAWLAAQLNPQSIDDSQLGTYLPAMPAITGNATTDDKNYNRLEDRIIQREVASNAQLLEKVTEHWLDHFAVGNEKVSDSFAMMHYEETVRADALGNFGTLVSDISIEPAILLWLDNNGNVGTDASNPPNENFGREVMQLYTIGINQLNMDGSNVLDANQNPLPAYGEPDVKQVALALTGFQTFQPYPLPSGQPDDQIDVEHFNANAHARGPYTIIGQTVADPGDATVVNDVVSVLAHNPSVAPFEAKELLQRFVTETPSPGYITRIATVWQSTENDPAQIAKVLQAIVDDPEFIPAVDSQVKTPVEFSIDSVRALHGAHANPATNATGAPLGDIDNDEYGTAMQLWNAPTVFSFYRPGNKESLLTNYYLLQRWNIAADIANNVHTGALNTGNQLNMDLSGIATLPPAQQASYLLDALVDGGDPELRSLVTNYLTGGNTINGAVWLILASPKYEVN
jgi:uncharacterized protein (DUF1800 family)